MRWPQGSRPWALGHRGIDPEGFPQSYVVGPSREGAQSVGCVSVRSWRANARSWPEVDRISAQHARSASGLPPEDADLTQIGTKEEVWSTTTTNPAERRVSPAGGSISESCSTSRRHGSAGAAIACSRWLRHCVDRRGRRGQVLPDPRSREGGRGRRIGGRRCLSRRTLGDLRRRERGAADGSPASGGSDSPGRGRGVRRRRLRYPPPAGRVQDGHSR